MTFMVINKNIVKTWRERPLQCLVYKWRFGTLTSFWLWLAHEIFP